MPVQGLRVDHFEVSAYNTRHIQSCHRSAQDSVDSIQQQWLSEQTLPTVRLEK